MRITRINQQGSSHSTHFALPSNLPAFCTGAKAAAEPRRTASRVVFIMVRVLDARMEITGNLGDGRGSRDYY